MTRAVLLTLLAMLCLAVPAQAKKPIVGIAEQNPAIFTDQRWLDLAKPDVRYVIPWDALKYKKNRASADWYLSWARDNNAPVLLSFGHSNKKSRALRLPTRSQFKAQFKAIRKRYPWVTTFQTWNEANHGSQPTFNKPAAAAKFFDIIKSSCSKCVVSAPSVLDDGMKTINWIKQFRKAAKHKVTIWSLHNHIDANRNRLGNASTTKLFLRNTTGQVWFTETGGIWNRWLTRKTGRKVRVKMYNHKTAQRAVRNVFKLQRLSPRRVTRIYYYNWFAPGEKKPQWDSGLIDAKGKSRPLFNTFKAQVRKYAR